MILSIYILNKAGGLVFQRDFNGGLNRMSSNDYLVLAGTFHSVHALTSKISPKPGSSGLLQLQAESFTMHCSQTLTGLKFLVFTDAQPGRPGIFMRTLYELYSDYVMKNPFYQLEMPIRCEAFDEALLRHVKATN